MTSLANMAEAKEGGDIARVVLFCILWYSISSGNNVVGKTLLNEFPYPVTVTMVQLVSIAVYSSPVLKWMAVRRRTDVSLSYYKRIIIPLAFGKFISSVSSHVSIWRVPVSYAHTVKATMPFFTVVLARMLMGEKQTTKVYFSLVPIILGVALATITELSFDMLGLVAALLATCGFSLQNIFSKKVLNDTGMHHLRLLHLLGYLALFMFLPVWLITDARTIFYDKTLLTNRDPRITIFLLVVDGGLSWLQNFVAFTILHHVTPLTYAVANASKRISIITVSLILLKNPITMPNVAGMFLAIMGVLGYNKAKYDANKSRKKSALVPLSQVTSAKHLVGSNGVSNTLQDLYHPLYDSGSLQSSPFHPSYSNHVGSSRLGLYPRMSGMSDGMYQVSQNGFVHVGVNSTTDRDRAVNGSVEAII